MSQSLSPSVQHSEMRGTKPSLSKLFIWTSLSKSFLSSVRLFMYSRLASALFPGTTCTAQHTVTACESQLCLSASCFWVHYAYDGYLSAFFPIPLFPDRHNPFVSNNVCQQEGRSGERHKIHPHALLERLVRMRSPGSFAFRCSVRSKPLQQSQYISSLSLFPLVKQKMSRRHNLRPFYSGLTTLPSFSSRVSAIGLMDLDVDPRTEYADPFAEADTIAASGSVVRKNGSLLTVQLYHFNAVDANVHTVGSLAGLHLVRDSRRGDWTQSTRLGRQ